MNYLLPEEKRDVLKFLNFVQLFSLRQTNFYFRNLINEYDGDLALMKFYELEIIDIDPEFNSYKEIDLKSGLFDFTLNDQLMEKWQTAIKRSIPLFLHSFEATKNIAVIIRKTAREPYILKLPNFPKNIGDMILTRCWLEHLFNCAFEDAYFGKSFLNPEMIQLLFDDDKTIPYQFHVECFRMKPVNNNFGNILKFALNHLAITETLLINFDGVDNADIDSLMSILINKGGELQQIYYSSLKLPTLYNLIIKHITTSTDCSKMVAYISLLFPIIPNLELDERAKNVKIQYFNPDIKMTTYQIANIYNPKVKFSFHNIERRNAKYGFEVGYVRFSVGISKMKKKQRDV